MKRKTVDAARGKWRGIFIALGLDAKHFTKRHCACPTCGGTDRFRFDDKGGNGSFICNVCGAGNGFNLLMLAKGWDFAQAAMEVDRIVGNIDAEAPPKTQDEAAIRERKRRLWAESRQIVPGDMAFAYLSSRVPMPKSVPQCLRFSPSCMAPDGVSRPALLAMVQDEAGKGRNIHRTFISLEGKADMQQPRAMMPGVVPDGSAVRLFPVHGERLGIAEGIETALAAAAKFSVPVWSAINSTMLAKWMPPATVREVIIFGDSDAKFGGQAAAYRLAHRLATNDRLGLSVSVHIPRQLGRDWADSDVA